MAKGTVTLFEETALRIGTEKFQFATDTLKLGYVTSGVTPTAADAAPTWASYSGSEVSTAGGYTADGETLTSVTYTETGGVATLDAADVELAQNGSGFTNARWGILYDDTEATDMAIGFVDLGGNVSEQDGPVNMRWHASGIASVTVTPPS